ncbi:hypothetical protein FSP39_017205 [Pinctada imbricata]|uniref:Uncharacterized protein n=1 Tax=Pinctada imbricata TaxID=66713 RepID=A0AA89BYW3_PINIB|nr:hypothetical protein FSP39_017205 [Pinctada imbricata]
MPYCTIPERLQMLAKQTPDKEAIVFVGEQKRIGVTYQEIVDGALEMARKMLTIGIKKNDVVAIHDDKSPSWLFYTFGAQMCGAWPLHFYFQRKDGSDVADILKRSGCKIVISQPGDGDEYIQIMKSFLQFKGDGTVESKNVPTLKQVLLTRKPASLQNPLTFDEILPSSKDLPLTEPEDIAGIFCSSGSTGLPKMISWSHTNTIASALSTLERLEFTEGQSYFCDRTFGWIGGYPREIFIGIRRVTNSTTFKEKNVKEVCDATVRIINQENCEHVVLFSTTIDELMKGNYMMKPVQTIATGGGPISAKDSQLVGKFCQKFIHAYGSTENGAISLNVITSEQKMKSYDTGVPFPGIEVKVTDMNGCLSEVGDVGEVYVRNRLSSTGYLHEEQDWHKSNRVEGYWFKTGDSGYISGDGHLFVAGRISEAIMIEGKILSPSHFEDIFKRNPYVEDVVAFGIPDEVFYEVAGLAVLLKEGKSVCMEELLEFYKIERSLRYDDSFYASKFVPRQIVFFDSFPMTNSGKIARKLVKEMALEKIGFHGRKN